MFDFTTVPNRRGGDSIKWSGPEKELPMWIADMDFQTAPAVIEALQQKVATGIFGYEEPPREYFQAVSDWYETRHQTAIPLDWQLFATGVIPALSASIRRVTNAGDNVVVQTPVYNMFFLTPLKMLGVTFYRLSSLMTARRILTTSIGMDWNLPWPSH